MALLAVVSLAGLSVVVGVLIGGIGIGGVLLVPCITYIFEIPIHVAVAAAMFSYLFSGAVGATVYARKRTIRWTMALWLFAGAAPAAFVGALALSVTPPRWIEFLIALLIVFAGINALTSADGDDAGNNVTSADSNGGGYKALRSAPLAGIGAITGCGSALTGTGGPLILVPILVWLRAPVRTAVGLSQAIQLPIAALATVGNFISGTVDVVVGGTIAAGLMIGTAIGARIAHAVSPATLRTVVAWILVAVGFFIIGRLVLPWLPG